MDTDSANECLVENGIQSLTSLLNKVENQYLSKSPFLCGTQLTIADSFMVTTLLQSQWGGFNFTIWPKVRSWFIKVTDQSHWETVHKAHMDFLDDITLTIE